MDTKAYWIELKEKFTNFYTGNKKIINGISISLVVLIGGGTYWKMFYLPEQEKKASEKFAKMYHYFKIDSTSLVLNGSKTLKITSAPDIADEYSSTKKGNEAALVAGISYLKTKKFELAKKYLNKVNSRDVVLNSSVISMKAVCESELGNAEKAAKLFEKAALIGENDFSAMYLKKAGIHYESENEFKNALRCYETIKQKYSMTAEGSDIDKYIYKMKAALGEYNP